MKPYIHSKIIFLDCDGVVNSKKFMLATGPIQSASSNGWKEDWIDPEAIVLLNEIIERTNASVVLSSTWRRLNTLEVINNAFKAMGFISTIIDKTPYLGGADRGKEIDAWLKEYPLVSKFIILDDDSDMYPHMDKLIKTSWEYGLTQVEVELAVDMLNKD